MCSTAPSPLRAEQPLDGGALAARPAPPWPTRVQKFGGTSVGDIDRIDKVAERVARAVAGGEKVAVVVSAMGRTTDRLIGMARELTSRPSRRELEIGRAHV